MTSSLLTAFDRVVAGHSRPFCPDCGKLTRCTYDTDRVVGYECWGCPRTWTLDEAKDGPPMCPECGEEGAPQLAPDRLDKEVVGYECWNCDRSFTFEEATRINHDYLKESRRREDEFAEAAMAKLGFVPVKETPMTLDEAMVRLRRVLGLQGDKDYWAVLIWGAQCHLVDLLTSVFYLGFAGPTGSGKGTGVESALELAPNGVNLGAKPTVAFLARALDEGRAIGVQQWDDIFEEDAQLAAIVLTGYRRGAKYGLMVPGKGKAWDPKEVDIFGPKVFDYRGPLDAHLLGRTVGVAMAPDNSVDRALDAEDKAEHLAPVRLWLAGLAERAKEEWTPERAVALRKDPAFRAKVVEMGGRVGRDHVVASILLLVCRVMGWDADAVVKSIITGRRTVDVLGPEAEVAQAILDLVGGQVVAHGDGSEWTMAGREELPTEMLLQYINDRRDALHLRGLSPRRLGGILGDLGFVRGGRAWYRARAGDNRNKWVVLPGKHMADLEKAVEPDGLDSDKGDRDGDQATMDGFHEGNGGM